MKRKEVDRHCRRCEHEMASCPNKGCDVKMLRKDVEAHQDECPEAMVRCAHAEDGCKARMKRKNLEEHMEANKFEHLQLQVVALRAENAALQKDLRTDILTKQKELEHGTQIQAVEDQLKSMKAQHATEIRQLSEYFDVMETCYKQQLAAQKEQLDEDRRSWREEIAAKESRRALNDMFRDGDIARLQREVTESTRGERCVVKLPINTRGNSTTWSKDFTLLGERWKLNSSRVGNHRNVHMEIVSAEKYAVPFSFKVLPAQRGISSIQRSASDAGDLGASWGWSDVVSTEDEHGYLQNGGFYVEVHLLECPITSR